MTTRYIFLVLGVLGLVFLTSCISLRPSLGKGVPATHEGFIERFVSPTLAADDYKSAYDVQFLLNRGNDVTFLMSETVPLSDPDYLGQKARVSGTLYHVDDEFLMKVDELLVLIAPPAEEEPESGAEESVEISDTPEATESGNYAAVAQSIKDSMDKVVTRFEFVEPNYVYVYYQNSDGGEDRRELLTYEINSSDKVVTQQIGHFKPGLTRDWDLLSGADPVASKSKNVITVDNDTVATVTTIQEGFRYLESKPLGFRIQYPSNWYYARLGSGYVFSNEPVSDTNVLLSLKLSLHEDDDGVIPRYLGVASLTDSRISVSYQAANGSIYDLIGEKSYQEIMEKMIQTIELLE